MATTNRGGRPKRFTAKAFESAVDAYFASISYSEPVQRREPVLEDDGTPKLDRYGHEVWRYLPIVTADGEAATVTRWTKPPSMAALCLHLGIDAATFSRYASTPGDDPESVRFRNAAMRARGRVEAYLTERLEDGKASRGAIFSLQHNFGWKERQEISLDESTRKAVSQPKTMTMAERLEILREVGDLPEVQHE